MKYIDAEKLIHDLEERIFAYSEGYAAGDDCRKDAIETLLKDVKYQLSLQEMPDSTQLIAEWEREDEKIRKELVNFLQSPFIKENLIDEKVAPWISYLEKQKEQKPAEWSEEDEHRCKDAIYFLETAKKHYADTSEIELTIEWLKFLRPQPKKELSIEKAIKWLDDTFYFLDNSSGRGRDCEITTHDFDSLEEMYDSFRKAVIVDSEPHWKPKDEQMIALKPESDLFGEPAEEDVWIDSKEACRALGWKSISTTMLRKAGIRYQQPMGKHHKITAHKGDIENYVRNRRDGRK